MRGRRRGFALVHVLAVALMLGAAGVAWRAASSAAYAHAVRGHDRARARAVAQAAWERARVRLAAGQDPAGAGPVLDGEATVRVEPLLEARRRVVIDALARRRDGQAVHARLVLEVELAPGAVRVVSRLEVGA